MPDAARLRDSTQILVPEHVIEGIGDDIEDRFTVTIRREEDGVRIIGSPTEIKDTSEFLARNGVTLA